MVKTQKRRSGIRSMPAGMEIRLRTPGHEPPDEHRRAPVPAEPRHRTAYVVGVHERDPVGRRADALQPPRGAEPVEEQRAEQRADGRPGDRGDQAVVALAGGVARPAAAPARSARGGKTVSSAVARPTPGEPTVRMTRTTQSRTASTWSAVRAGGLPQRLVQHDRPGDRGVEGRGGADHRDAGDVVADRAPAATTGRGSRCRPRPRPGRRGRRRRARCPPRPCRRSGSRGRGRARRPVPVRARAARSARRASRCWRGRPAGRRGRQRGR